jgi:hypothetical protein
VGANSFAKWPVHPQYLYRLKSFANEFAPTGFVVRRDYVTDINPPVAVRLAGGGVLEIATAGKPCCYSQIAIWLL